MAQQQNKKVNLSSAKLGMNKDTHPSQLQEAQYTHAYNANTENESGNSLNITNEKSNILASKFKAGFKVIGLGNDIDTNSTYFLLTNPTTGVGEFGVIESNQNTNDIADATVDCTDCDQIKTLSEPLENITQTSLQTYKTLLTDATGYLDVTTNTCMPFVKGQGFNFDINHPIKKIVIKNEKSGKTAYFSDNYNSPRHINITNINKYFIQNVPCNDDVTTACINFDELRIFKRYSIPKITPTSIELGGRLKMGMYEFLLAYCDAEGNEISPYYSITNPVAIFDKNNVVLEQKEIADRTSLAIRLEVSNLDQNYSHYKVAVIQTADIEGATRYFIEGIHTINDNSVLYTTEQGKLTTTIDKLLIKPLDIEKTENLTDSNNILFQTGLTIKKEINLQPIVNLLGQFLKFQTHIAPENLYDNGVLSSKYLGYNRDEVVPFSIRFLLDGGYETALFPLISRALRPGEDASMVNGSGVGINEDVRSIIENLQDCNSNNRTKKWQFYNTADSPQGSVCEGVGVETVQVEEEVSLTCIVEGVGTVGPDTLQIDIDDDTYVSLSQYIEDNKQNCNNEFLGTDICAVLTADYSSVLCETDVFEGYNVSGPISTLSDVIVGDITDVVETKIEKIFPTEYTKVKPPVSCSIYKSKSDGTGYELDPDITYNTVYLRNSYFENEDCTYANAINAFIGTGDNPNTGNFNNYYANQTQASLLTSKLVHPLGIESGFLGNLHKGALWFNGDTEGKTSFIVDISKQRDSDGSDYLASLNIKKQRISIFKKCSDAAAIYSRVIDMDNGEILLFQKVGADLKITTSLGDVQTITNGWPTNKKYLIAVDSYMADLTSESNGYLIVPVEGCYTITKRDIEFSRIDVSWSSIRVDKRMISTAICIFDQPIVQSCKAVPYRKGNFAYWESEETYPDNPELYDSTNLIIPENLVPNSIETEFKNTFVLGVNDGNYILGQKANFTCKPIRHFRFPDNKVAPFMSPSPQSPFSSSLIFPLGITIDEEVINSFLDIAVVNGLLTQEDRNKVSGYEIFRGDTSLDRSVLASGLLYDMRQYTESGKKVQYSNYPFNSYQDDLLNKDSDKPSTWGISNTNYTFHSPETDYYRQTLPSELSIQGYMYGNSRGHFDEVKDHPKWVILSPAAKKLAGTLATLEVAGEILIKAAEITSNAQTWAMIGLSSGASLGLPAFISAGVVTVFGTAEAIIYKQSQYKYQWLKIFRDFGRPQNFAYYYFAEGHYNYNLPLQQEGNKLRGMHIAKYLNDGRFRVTNEVTSERLDINNIDREKSVFVSLGDKPLVYPNSGYSSYDNGSTSSITYQSEAGVRTSGRSPEISKNIASPYAAVKNYLPSQYGTISSVKWLSTGHVGDLKNATANCLSIFGGDTYISRHTLKRKMPLFLVTAMKQADLTPFNYFFYSNIGKDPRFFCSYEQNTDFSSKGKTFPDIDSTYVFDNNAATGNYIVPPSKFYLYYYGVPSFLTETRINTNYRYAGKTYERSFFPQVGDLGTWTQETVVSIREPNVFLYNNEYSKQISYTRKRVLSDTYSKEVSDKLQDMPNGIIASLPDSTENSIYDPWLIYRPLDTFEFPSSYGKLKDIIDIEGQAILARFANTSVLYNKVDSKIDDGTRPELATLGGSSFFQRRSTSFHNTNLGYGGTENAAYISNEYGHFYADAKRGQVVMVPTNGEGMVEISAMSGNNPSGMRNWFKEHLPFKILKYIPNTDIDNPYNGVGLTMGWDSRYRRVFLTKKDYIPKSDCIEYLPGQGFAINNTKCGGEQIPTCAEGYVYNEITEMCERSFTSTELCPEGYTYNNVTKTCTLVETLPATCVCTADVSASPQEICSGSSTSIALTSTVSGIGYNWTVVQSGVSGATSGSGSTISQTLSGAGTATYTVTPYEIAGGCQGTPIQVVVTVKAIPDVIATPNSLDVTEGETITIQLSGSVAGTTFSWTVVNSGTSGPANGSGNTITAVATGSGTSTYTITPSKNGCIGQPITVVVNVGALVITNNTQINIWFDNSGSMNSTLSPLQTMANTILKPCLLPAYNNDSALYDARVKVLNFDSETNGFENYINLLAERSSDPQVTKVINLTFADESTPYEQETNYDPTPNSTITSAIALLRSTLESGPTNSLLGVGFQVATGGFGGFRTFVNNVHTGVAPYTGVNGLSDKQEIGYMLDVTPGSTPQYYANLIVSALNNLGFNLSPC